MLMFGCQEQVMWMFGEMCVFQTAASWGQGWTIVSYFYLFMLNLPSLECQLLESRDIVFVLFNGEFPGPATGSRNSRHVINTSNEYMMIMLITVNEMPRLLMSQDFGGGEKPMDIRKSSFC